MRAEFIIGMPGNCVPECDYIWSKRILEEIVKDFKDNSKCVGAFCDSIIIPPIPLDRVSHVVHGLRTSGGKLIADIEVLNTPMGNKLALALLFDSPIFRMRGTGTTCGNYIKEFKLATINAHIKDK